MYCFKCKKHTDSKNKQQTTSVNGRPYIKAECSDCGRTKCQFMKGSVGKGVVSFKNSGDHLVKVQLTKAQIKKLLDYKSNAKSAKIRIHLPATRTTGKHELLLNRKSFNRLQNALKNKSGVILEFNKTNIQKLDGKGILSKLAVDNDNQKGGNLWKIVSSALLPEAIEVGQDILGEIMSGKGISEKSKSKVNEMKKDSNMMKFCKNVSPEKLKELNENELDAALIGTGLIGGKVNWKNLLKWSALALNPASFITLPAAINAKIAKKVIDKNKQSGSGVSGLTFY